MPLVGGRLTIELIIISKQKVDHLFETVLTPWQKLGRFLEKNKTFQELMLEKHGVSRKTLSQTGLKDQVEAICQESLSVGLARVDYSSHKLIFYLIDGEPISFSIPVSCFSEMQTTFEAPILCGTMHGKLNGSSVLVDHQGRTWLIDFSHAARGPLVFDYVSLESAIKFDLLITHSIQVRYEMEKQLLGVSRLDEEIDAEGLEPETQKALWAISRVRQHASTVIGHEMNAYLGILLFVTVNQLIAYNSKVRHTRRELIPYLHSLLSAAMLCQKLIPPPPEDLLPQAIKSLWIDESNKEVWVESRQVQLTSQEFELLLYLYHHTGQLCSRIAIAEHVFGAEYGLDMSEWEKRKTEDTRLNSTMSRLRKKIEPDPGRPKYISVVRGEGYRLEIDNK